MNNNTQGLNSDQTKSSQKSGSINENFERQGDTKSQKTDTVDSQRQPSYAQ